MNETRDELLDLTASCDLLGGSKPIHPATFYRGIKAGLYPRPVKISEKSNRWKRSELEAVVAKRTAERDAAAAA